MLELLIPQASTFAGDIDFVIELIFWIVLFWWALTQGAFCWLMFRFRRKDGVKAEYIDGSETYPKKVITWAHMAVLVFDVVIVVYAVQVWHNVKITLPPAEQTVRVIGQQWAWTFVHPGPDGELDTADDIAMNDELHLQVNTLYHYKLESKDVLHSLSIPAFRLKQDAIPGRVITGWFETTKTGDYLFQCTEICGIGHALMPARVLIETPEQHAAWMAANSPVSVAAQAPQAPVAVALGAPVQE